MELQFFSFGSRKMFAQHLLFSEKKVDIILQKIVQNQYRDQNTEVYTEYYVF